MTAQKVYTVTERPTIYDDLLAAGVPVDSHESDLYCKATPEAREIIKRHNASARGFVSEIDGQLWLELPFQYKPFWDAVAKRGSK